MCTDSTSFLFYPPASLLLSQENGLQSLPSRTAQQISILLTSFLTHSWLPWCLPLCNTLVNIISWKNTVKGIRCLKIWGKGGEAALCKALQEWLRSKTELPHRGSCPLWGCTSCLWPRDQEARPKKGPLLLLTCNNGLLISRKQASKWPLACWCRKLQVSGPSPCLSRKTARRDKKVAFALTSNFQILSECISLLRLNFKNRILATRELLHVWLSCLNVALQAQRSCLLAHHYTTSTYHSTGHTAIIPHLACIR